jgi:hypothetical protein
VCQGLYQKQAIDIFLVTNSQCYKTFSLRAQDKQARAFVLATRTNKLERLSLPPVQIS